jgi:hypothetical protein
MKRLLLSLIGAALLAVGGLTATASASTIVNPIFTPQLKVGDHAINPQIDGAGVYTAGHKFGSHTNFTDKLTFSITSATSLVLKVLTFGSIDLHFTLKDGSTNAIIQSTSIGSGTLRGHSGTLVTELLSLNKVGTWVLTLTGTACSCAGYVVALSSAVTPVPPALLMFLTGLIGLGGFGWRRRSRGGVMASVA